MSFRECVSFIKVIECFGIKLLIIAYYAFNVSRTFSNATSLIPDLGIWVCVSLSVWAVIRQCYRSAQGSYFWLNDFLYGFAISSRIDSHYDLHYFLPPALGLSCFSFTNTLRLRLRPVLWNLSSFLMCAFSPINLPFSSAELFPNPDMLYFHFRSVQGIFLLPLRGPSWKKT